MLRTGFSFNRHYVTAVARACLRSPSHSRCGKTCAWQAHAAPVSLQEEAVHTDGPATKDNRAADCRHTRTPTQAGYLQFSTSKIPRGCAKNPGQPASLAQSQHAGCAKRPENASPRPRPGAHSPLALNDHPRRHWHPRRPPRRGFSALRPRAPQGSPVRSPAAATRARRRLGMRAGGRKPLQGSLAARRPLRRPGRPPSWASSGSSDCYGPADPEKIMLRFRVCLILASRQRW